MRARANSLLIAYSCPTTPVAQSVYYETRVIRPMALFVFISWCTFFLQRSALPARTGLSSICLLSASGLTGTVYSALPKLSEVRPVV